MTAGRRGLTRLAAIPLFFVALAAGSIAGAVYAGGQESYWCSHSPPPNDILACANSQSFAAGMTFLVVFSVIAVIASAVAIRLARAD